MNFILELILTFYVFYHIIRDLGWLVAKLIMALGGYITLAGATKLLIITILIALGVGFINNLLKYNNYNDEE